MAYNAIATIIEPQAISTYEFLETLSTEKRLPIVMQNNDFWLDFINSAKEEISLMIEEIKLKTRIYDIDLMSLDRLFEISQLFGVYYDTAIDDSVEFVRREVKELIFKLTYKATPILYKSFSKSVDRLSELFLYYYTGSDVVRNSYSLLRDIVTHSVTTPYTHYSKEEFTGFLAEDIVLDSGLFLDTGWFLDTKIQKTNTNHLAIEYTVDELISLDGTNYSMTDDYLQYIRSNTEPYKRVIEVMHIGSQLNVIADSSKTVNTITDIQAKCRVTDNYNPLVSEGSYIKFGTGVQNISAPITDVATEISRVNVISDESYDISDWFGYVGEYMGENIKDRSVSSLYTSITLKYPEIRKKTCTINLKYNAVDYSFSDLDGEFSYTFPDNEKYEGTINYKTGLINMTTTPANPSLTTNIIIDYYTFQTINITEAGLFNSSDELISYATFPPFEFKWHGFHMNCGFLLKKTNF